LQPTEERDACYSIGFMPALHTQRFATMLTHQLTCFSHAEYHYCVTVYQSDVKSELQSVCKEKLKFTMFTFSPRKKN